MTVSSERLKKPLEILVYAALVGISYPLINGIYQEYSEGKTAFSSDETEAVEIKDNPAVLVGFWTNQAIQFGIDYNGSVLHWNEELGEYRPDPDEVIVYHDRPGEKATGMTSNTTTATQTVIDITRMVTRHADEHMLLISPLTTLLVDRWEKTNT